MSSGSSAKRVNMVMLVDDNETDNFIHRRVIELTAFTGNIVTKDTGRAALDYLNLHKDKTESLPDIIFLDLNMPVLDGFGFLSEFQKFSEEIKSKCKIVILTSSNNKNDFDHVKKYSFVKNYFTKPLSEEALYKIK
jgi:CheY-like chemotaxis protein